MSNLVERLRALAGEHPGYLIAELAIEAADEIERLRKWANHALSTLRRLLGDSTQEEKP